MIILAESGKSSSGMKMNRLIMRYFFMTEKLKKERSNLHLPYTWHRWVLSKPLQGALFTRIWEYFLISMPSCGLLGLPWCIRIHLFISLKKSFIC